DPMAHLLERARMALKPDGCLLISGHNALALRHFNGQRDTLGREGTAALESRFTGRAPHFWPAFTISKALQESGFHRQIHCALMGPLDCPKLIVSPLGCELAGKSWNLETLLR